MGTNVRGRDRRVAVTGSSSGIGLAIARRLLEDGWNVLGIDIAPSVISDLKFNAIEADLSDPWALAGAADLCSDVYALIHAAGILGVAPLEELVSQDRKRLWQIHVDAIAYLAGKVVPSMKSGGRVIVIGSRVAGGFPGRSYYAACKSALIGLVRSWAAEVVERGITVNIISPAATETPMLGDPSRSVVGPKVPPIGRFIRPEEIADLVSFLLSPSADAITGQEIVICGGASLAV